MTPREFLDLVWQYKPEEEFVLIWTLQDKQSHWFTDIGQAAEFVVAASKGMDAYVGVGLSKEDRGPHHRVKSEEVSSICGIATDLDLKSEAHGNKPLPATLADALSILPKDMPPTIIIVTGNGAHAWWLLKEPHAFESDEDRAEVARLVARWHTMLRLKSQARGWSYDRLSDLARILRIPGTLNHKDAAHPKEVRVNSQSGRLYHLSDFEEYLDDAQIPDPEEQERAAREWHERFADKALAVNPNAEIPKDVLDGWLREDMRFRNTWLRQRHDLKDQSGSGYDLALACFGFDAGLTEQQIVDLICHHRRVHNKPARTRLDYYQRTLSKAEKKTGGGKAAATGLPPVSGTTSASPVAGLAASQAGPVAPEQQEATGTTTGDPDAPDAPAPDPEVQKQLLCDHISKVIGIPVARFVKITGKEPQYRMELLDGQKIELANVNKLLAYESVRSAIAATVGRIIPKIKPKEWEALAQMMLDACIIVQGTEEMEWEGAARMYLQHYLSETGFIPCIEGQRLQDQRKPMVISGEITVCASDLQTYVNKTTFQNLSVKAVAGMLSAIGAESIRVRGPKFKDQSRWVLPIAEFDPAEYPQHEGGSDAE
jgi:hypothetical protein